MGTWAHLRRRLRIFWRIGGAGLGLLAGLWLGERIFPRGAAPQAADDRPAIARLADPPGRPETVLLMGVDSENLQRGQRGEVQLLWLARVYPEGGLELLQLPSELAVQIPGQRQLQPLAALHRLGGVALTAEVVGQLVGGEANPQPPDRYLLLPRATLRQAVAAIGGLPIALETPLRYQDKAGKLTINLQAGQQWLGGQELEQLLRFKGPDPGDGGRRQRQQQLLLPLADRLADASVAPGLGGLVGKLQKQLDTNLSQGEILSLLAAGLRDPDRIVVSRLPLTPPPGPPRLEQSNAEPLLEHWRQGQRPDPAQGTVHVEASLGPATDAAIDGAIQRLERAGLAPLLSPTPLELPIPRTLIRHGSDPKQALAVRKALGLGELQRGAREPGASVQVLLGQDWPAKP